MVTTILEYNKIGKFIKLDPLSANKSRAKYARASKPSAGLQGIKTNSKTSLTIQEGKTMKKEANQDYKEQLVAYGSHERMDVTTP